MKKKPAVRCQVCGKECNGEEVGRHKQETGHNRFELLIPKEES